MFFLKHLCTLWPSKGQWHWFNQTLALLRMAEPQFVTLCIIKMPFIFGVPNMTYNSEGIAFKSWTDDYTEVLKLCMMCIILFQTVKGIIQYKKQPFTWAALVDEVLKAFAILTA